MRIKHNKYVLVFLLFWCVVLFMLKRTTLIKTELICDEEACSQQLVLVAMQCVFIIILQVAHCCLIDVALKMYCVRNRWCWPQMHHHTVCLARGALNVLLREIASEWAAAGSERTDHECLYSVDLHTIMWKGAALLRVVNRRAISDCMKYLKWQQHCTSHLRVNFVCHCCICVRLLLSYLVWFSPFVPSLIHLASHMSSECTCLLICCQWQQGRI